jgi:hypothetical protein
MSQPSRPPLFVLLFFSIFGFVGVGVLIFLWGSSDGFGAPPLPFKLFGSLVALGFIAMGFGMPISTLRSRRSVSGHDPAPPIDPGSYACPSCGGNVKNAEVSPSGDVKCPYCKGWWNIHRG